MYCIECCKKFWIKTKCICLDKREWVIWLRGNVDTDNIKASLVITSCGTTCTAE